MRSIAWYSVAVVSTLFLVACSDDGQTTTGSGGGTTTSAGGGAQGGGAQGGGAQGGGAQGGGAQGGGAQGGGAQGGGGSAGTGGEAPFGPCQGIVENFDAFDVASTTDAWESDDVVSLTNGQDKALVAEPDADGYAGLFSATPALAENCFFGVAVEGQQQPGGYVIELLEPNDTGRKVMIEVDGTNVTAANIINAQGDGDILGTAMIATDLRGMRIQVLAGQLLFEVKDTSGAWQTAATLAPAPDWIGSPLLLGFGYRSDTSDVGTFDDVNVEVPL
jgi:hypothetical protein